MPVYKFVQIIYNITKTSYQFIILEKYYKFLRPMYLKKIILKRYIWSMLNISKYMIEYIEYMIVHFS